MYNNLEISMAQFRADIQYEDYYKMVAEINGVTFESQIVKTLDKWAETLKCKLKDVETRIIE